VFSNLESLLGALPDDDHVRVSHPQVLVADISRHRIPQEQLSVQVDAYLWYIKKESVNDYYHLILGSTAGADARYMVGEVPGLPADGEDSDTLRVRTQLMAMVGIPPGSERFEALTPPLRIRVTGSLFFNGDHRPAAEAPTGHEPRTAWEIHPVSDLQAL
jgi:hypothetical protein